MEQIAGRSLKWRVPLLLIVGVTAVLRFAVARHSLWFDEQASMFFSDQPFGRLWSDWMLRETNPPLFYSLLRVWRAVFGSTDLAARALPVTASLLAIVLVFVLARRVYGTRAGLIGAALTALSGQQLYFAEQARAYVLVLCSALVAIGALLTFGTAEDRATSWRAAAAYALAATVAIYLHTTMLLFPPVTFAAVIAADPLRYAKRPALLLPLFVANIAVLLGSSWAIRRAVLQILNHGENIAAIGLTNAKLIAVYPLQTLLLSGGVGKMGYGIAVLVLVLVAAFVVLDRHRRETRLLAATGLLAVATFGIIGMFAPVFVPRTIFWASAVPLLLASGALARIPEGRSQLGAFAVLAALLVVDTARLVPKLEQENWNEPVRVLAQRPDAVLLVQGEAMAVLADGVCRRQLRRGTCPYAVVAVTDPDDRFDSWARDTFPGPKVQVTELPAYATGRTVFMFRKAYYHSLPDLLHARGLGHGVVAGGPPLLGPMSAAALR